MALKITERQFFLEVLRRDIPELDGVAQTYENEGAVAASRDLRAFLREYLVPKAQRYFSQPDGYRENAWYTEDESEIEMGERILENRMISIGMLHDFGEEIDWEFDLTGGECREWVWQLNRHHEWRHLAYLYRITGERRYIRKMVEFLVGFAEQTECPPRGTSGFATKSYRTIELGIRMANNYPYCILTAFDSPDVTDAELVTFLRLVYENAQRLRYDNTTHNWLIMEMNGLLHISVLLPIFREADEWREYAYRRLTEQLDLQLYPDGFQFELTTNYHGCVLMNYRTIMRMMRVMDEPIPEEFYEKIRKGYHLYPKIVQPDGTIPNLNDGNRMSVKGELCACLEDFPDDPVFNHFRTNGREGELPSYCSVALPYSGYAVMRSGFGREDSYAMLECAPFGFAHQHEDKLEVLLWAYGKELLTDVGGYRYDTSDMRKYCLSSYAHNTAIVDGMGQNRRNGYCWQAEDINKRAAMRYGERENFVIAEGVYDEGYGDGKLDVTHTRTLLWLKNGTSGFASPFYLVLDTFCAEGVHTYETLWHAADDFAYTETAGGVDFDCRDDVHFRIQTSADMRVVRGQSEPYLCGWLPRREGEHQLAAVAVCQTTAQTEASMVTLLYPYVEGRCADAPERVTLNGDTVTLHFYGRTVALSLSDYIDALK